jgi:hypothetical protein
MDLGNLHGLVQKSKSPRGGTLISFSKVAKSYLFLEDFFAAFFFEAPFLAAAFFFGAAFLAAFFAVAIVF